MFGMSSDIKTLVEKGKWPKVEKSVRSNDSAARAEAAKALSASKADEAYNLLIDLLKDSDPNVQMEAIKSLGVVGSTRAADQLQWVLDRTPETDTARIAELRNSITQVRSRQR